MRSVWQRCHASPPHTYAVTLHLSFNFQFMIIHPNGLHIYFICIHFGVVESVAPEMFCPQVNTVTEDRVGKKYRQRLIYRVDIREARTHEGHPAGTGSEIDCIVFI